MIRHATMADVDEIARLEASSFPAAEAASRESIAARVAAFPECFWLVEDDAMAGAACDEGLGADGNRAAVRASGDGAPRAAAGSRRELLAFVDGMVTATPDLTDEMYDYPELHDPTAAWLMVFSVASSPAHRGEGHATAALRAAIACARERGQRGVVLTCKERLLGFYGRFGFVNEGVSSSEHGGAEWYQMRLTF